MSHRHGERMKAYATLVINRRSIQPAELKVFVSKYRGASCVMREIDRYCYENGINKAEFVSRINYTGHAFTESFHLFELDIEPQTCPVCGWEWYPVNGEDERCANPDCRVSQDNRVMASVSCKFCGYTWATHRMPEKCPNCGTRDYAKNPAPDSQDGLWGMKPAPKRKGRKKKV